MPEIRPNQNLLSRLPEHLSADLFTNTSPVQLAANGVLFMAGDAGDGCYLVEVGLLKVTMVSRSGTERILAFLGTAVAVATFATMTDTAPMLARGRPGIAV
jgi:CRP/FNR family transcriptional regulator, cyclic AMP receptor protein